MCEVPIFQFDCVQDFRMDFDGYAWQLVCIRGTVESRVNSQHLCAKSIFRPQKVDSKTPVQSAYFGVIPNLAHTLCTNYPQQYPWFSPSHPQLCPQQNRQHVRFLCTSNTSTSSFNSRWSSRENEPTFARGRRTYEHAARELRRFYVHTDSGVCVKLLSQLSRSLYLCLNHLMRNRRSSMS